MSILYALLIVLGIGYGISAICVTIAIVIAFSADEYHFGIILLFIVLGIIFSPLLIWYAYKIQAIHYS